MDELKAHDVGWVTPSHEEAAVTRPLCYSTTHPLYMCAGRLENKARRVPSQVKLQVSLKRKAVSSNLKEDIASFLH